MVIHLTFIVSILIGLISQVYFLSLEPESRLATKLYFFASSHETILFPFHFPALPRQQYYWFRFAPFLPLIQTTLSYPQILKPSSSSKKNQRI
ncbi:hypothetical protein BDZ91DRAFT_286864 [Kalaharituber pfeilii]|nr:hypothetical protein BDZ91DRAFT_286864 [Kalaharituber pfeilii]